LPCAQTSGRLLPQAAGKEIAATPTFFLNGTPVHARFGLEKLEEAIHVALHAAPAFRPRISPLDTGEHP